MAELWVGGVQRKGSLGLPLSADDNNNALTSIPGNWVSIAHSQGTLAAVSAAGGLYTCGYNFFGLLGNGTTGGVDGLPAQYQLTQVGSVTNWYRVWGGYLGTFHALRQDGTLWAWGNNGQQPYLGTGTLGVAPFEYHEPTQIAGDFTGLVQVICNEYATWFLFDDGRVFACGDNAFINLLDVDDSLKYYVPTEITARLIREGDESLVAALQISAVNDNSTTMFVRGDDEAIGGLYFANGYSGTVSGELGFLEGGSTDFIPEWIPDHVSARLMPFIMNGNLWALDSAPGNSDYPTEHHVGTGSSEASWVRCSAAAAFSAAEPYVILDKDDGGLYGVALASVSFPTDYSFDELVPPATFSDSIAQVLNPDTRNFGDGGTFVVLVGSILSDPQSIDQFLYRDLRFPFTTSGRAVQRLMKIELERNRRQRTVQFPAKLTGMRLLPWDGVYLDHARYGFEAEQHRVVGWTLAEDGGVDLSLQADDADVYAWDRLTDERAIAASQEVSVPDGSFLAAPVLTVDTPTTPEYLTITARWEVPIGAIAYDTYHRVSGAVDWVYHERTASNFFDTLHISDAFDFHVQAVSASGVTSAFGDNLAPGPATSLGFSNPDITWTNDADASQVQVFYFAADNFADSSLLTTIPGSLETYTVASNGYYWLRSVNAAGNVSVESASVLASGF